MTSFADVLPRLRAELERRERAELEAAQAAAGKRRLSDFLRAAWPVVEPGRPLVWGWHLDAVCEHLEAVTAGQIPNLLITIPPGCTKSRTVGVFWPAWTWLRWPEARWLFFSNADDLATRESLACRRLIESEWFQRHYPDSVRITTDQNTKTWYENDRTGHRQSMSVLASVTGKKGDLVVVDDANDAEKVQSEAIRGQVNSRWDNAIYDRVIDFKRGRRVVVGQRTHQQDLIGHIKDAGGFEELCIPEEFEPKRRFATSIGWSDPRTELGDLLREEQFGPEQITQAKARLGSIGYRAKHQQDPQSLEGYLFRREWLARRWCRDPDSPDYLVLSDDRGTYRFRLLGAERHATADGAASGKTSADYTVLAVWAVTSRGDLIWLDCFRDRLEIPDQPKLLRAAWERHKFKTVGVEAVASNRGLLQMAERCGLPAVPLTPKGLDKLAHAQGGLIEAEQGRLWLPGPGEVPDFPLDTVLSELLQFTGTKADEHDDCVDVLSYALDMKPRWMQGVHGAGKPGLYNSGGPGGVMPRRPLPWGR